MLVGLIARSMKGDVARPLGLEVGLAAVVGQGVALLEGAGGFSRAWLVSLVIRGAEGLCLLLLSVGSHGQVVGLDGVVLVQPSRRPGSSAARSELRQVKGGVLVLAGDHARLDERGSLASPRCCVLVALDGWPLLSGQTSAHVRLVAVGAFGSLAIAES